MPLPMRGGMAEREKTAMKYWNVLLHGGDYNPGQWLDRPDILKEDIRLMKLAGCNAMSVGIFDWERLEPEEGRYELDWLAEIIDNLYAEGIYTVLATPSGARPGWMAEKYPEVLRVNPDGRRILFAERHNHCLTSPIYREKVAQMNRALAERFGRHPAVILWHISNEYGGDCHCELCQAVFREWLKKKYGTLENLNHAYWSMFWSHSYSSWEQISSPMEGIGETAHHMLVIDWKRFTTDQTVSFMQTEKDALREFSPDVPVTTNLMSFYDGLNYGKFREICDVISWDNYPTWHNGDPAVPARIGMAHDWMRSLKPDRPFLMMESSPSATNWQEVAKLRRPGMHMLASMQAVAHGSDSVQYFQWRKGRGGSEKFHGAVVDHDCSAEHRVFREVSEVGKRLKALRSVAGTVFPSKVALLHDVENRWALGEMQGLHNKVPQKGYMADLLAFYRPFFDQGVNVDVVDQEADFTPYKLVVAPMLYLLRAGIAGKLASFVEKGGILVGTYWTGIVDENDLCYLGGVPGEGLDKVFGLQETEIDALYPQDSNILRLRPENILRGCRRDYEVRDLCQLVRLTTAQTLGEYGADFYAGTPALTVNEYGAGRAYFIGCRTGQDFLNDFLGKLCGDLQLRNLDAELPEGVTVSMRRDAKSGIEYLFVQNYSDAPAAFTLPEILTDAETGKACSGMLRLSAYELRVFLRAPADGVKLTTNRIPEV